MDAAGSASLTIESVEKKDRKKPRPTKAPRPCQCMQEWLHPLFKTNGCVKISKMSSQDHGNTECSNVKKTWPATAAGNANDSGIQRPVLEKLRVMQRATALHTPSGFRSRSALQRRFITLSPNNFVSLFFTASQPSRTRHQWRTLEVIQ